MRERFILDHSIDELSAIAQAAVHRAVAALHAQGVSTFFMEHGVLMEQAPDGTIRAFDEGKVSGAARLGCWIRGAGEALTP